jgi:CheY-like chemotaxis protein
VTAEPQAHRPPSGGASGGASDGGHRPLRLLVVDDSADDFDLLVLALRRASMDVTARHVANEEGLRAALAEEPWDAAVVDHVIPGYSGPEALKLLRAKHCS